MNKNNLDRAIYTLQASDGTSQQFKFPTQAEHITARQMATFQDLFNNASDLVKETKLLTDLTMLSRSAFVAEIAVILGQTLELDFLKANSILKKGENWTDLHAGVFLLYQRFGAIINQYVPKQRDSFAYKGKTFYIPRQVQDAFAGKETNPNLSMGDGHLLFQAEHNYSLLEQSHENEYNKYLTMLATVAREKDEIQFLDDVALKQRTKERILFFKDIGMDVVLDFRFFFLNSKMN